jgi:hypothetical protein
MTKARDLADFLGDNTSLNTINNAYAAGTLVPSSTNPSLIINGAMEVAQRGTTSTLDEYQTVDRFRTSNGGNDEGVTQEHHTLTSSDTGVWELGFRNSYKVTNGNQTSGAGTSDRVTIQHRIEGQDLATSGWDYTSASSDVTLSFWCKSSVAQNFYVTLQSYGGTQQHYAMETGSLTANTWTKITKTIPGASAVAFDNDNTLGALLEITLFRGTETTGTRALNVWSTYDTNVRVPDMDSTWYTTNDATFEITGVKLEVGSEATDFQHTSYREELEKCQRYYQQYGGGGAYHKFFMGGSYNSTTATGHLYLVEKMRGVPTGSSTGNFDGGNGVSSSCSLSNMGGFTEADGTCHFMSIRANANSPNWVAGYMIKVRAYNDATARIYFDAEL